MNEHDYTRDERRAMDKRAEDAARRELENDPNRKSPKTTQDRVDAAVRELRHRWGLE